MTGFFHTSKRWSNRGISEESWEQPGGETSTTRMSQEVSKRLVSGL